MLKVLYFFSVIKSKYNCHKRDKKLNETFKLDFSAKSQGGMQFRLRSSRILEAECAKVDAAETIRLEEGRFRNIRRWLLSL